MSRSMEVAVFNVAYGPEYDEPVPYSSLPRVTVQSDDSKELGDLLRGALDELRRSEKLVNVGPKKFYMAFVQPGSDNEPIAWGHRFQQSYYGVSEEGLLSEYSTELLGLTVGDLRRAGQSGDIDGDWFRPVVIPPEGLGGPGDLVSPILDFLNDLGLNIVGNVALGAVTLVAKPLKDKITDVPARRVARSWQDRGLDHPWKVRCWIDRHDSWNHAKVAKRLGITERSACDLLEALGYVRHPRRPDTWVVGTTKDARKARAKWEKAESRAFTRRSG